MDNNQALRPEFFKNLPTFVKDKQAEKAGASDEERLLYALSSSGGWRILKEYIDGLLGDLDNAADLGLAQGLSFEEIGKNTVVVNLAKGVVRRILDKVQDAKEACERPDGTVK